MDPESFVLQPPTSNLLKWVPVVSTCIGLAALGFQVFVLFPWHIQLSSEFAELQRSCLKP